jgi:SAM-dependent methyltransferase
MTSARTILPFVVDLIRPSSVVDVGCGIGTWLQVCRELDVDEIFGVDGDYVDPALLCVPAEHFLARDLTQPLRLDRKFDVALSLEVGEHLPASRAESFVSDLCQLAPAVLFSAAIPHQGGLRHINEQWPQYWADKFRTHGYRPIDCIRDRVWDDDRVAPWYAQNAVLYVSDAVRLNWSQGTPADAQKVLARVHPSIYMKYAGGRYQSTRRFIAHALARVRRTGA